MTAIEPVPVIPPRPKLTRAQRVRIFDQAAGLCHLCGLPIKHGEKWEAEHVVARERGGSDELKNLRPAHVSCHKPKTAADKKVIDKTRRTRAAHLGIEGRPTQLTGRTRDEMNRDREARRAARGRKESLAPRALYR